MQMFEVTHVRIAKSGQNSALEEEIACAEIATGSEIDCP
jgi:hypothetical protein